MGRRKSKRKPPPRRKLIQNLEKHFKCPFCNHERSCDVVLDMSRKLGRIACQICHEFFQTTIISLSEPIDVYNDWIDACDENNK
ncbi:CG40228 [Drosophila busckii]|uniref:Transcription elongation factor 1 homolog n=1 Tax=Drosophila busckii TaxID=30019 RepID=A0A0M5J0K3_DROBS|nr:transcription elongation factor 1 homolog [Drosophila busckii]ALC43874.1 CG40228 [Drosophila busckii]